MPLLLLRWRQVGREADGGVGAQWVQGVWFGEAGGGPELQRCSCPGKTTGWTLPLCIAAHYPQEQSDRTVTKVLTALVGLSGHGWWPREGGWQGAERPGHAAATLPSLSVNKSAQAGISCRKLLPPPPHPCIPGRGDGEAWEARPSPLTCRASAPTSSALSPAAAAGWRPQVLLQSGPWGQGQGADMDQGRGGENVPARELKRCSPRGVGWGSGKRLQTPTRSHRQWEK